MRTKTVMKDQGLKYFSALTSKQKDKSVLYVCGCIENDFQPYLLPIYRTMHNPELRGCKMFWYDKFKVYLPVNIKDFLRN